MSDFLLAADGDFLLTGADSASPSEQNLPASQINVRGDPVSYRVQLQAALPHGPACPRDETANWTAILDVFARGLAAIDIHAGRLLDEADPHTTFSMLPDWERTSGLPDPCSGQADTLQERRSILVSRITSRGGQSPGYFIDLAASLGYAVTIEEHDLFRCDEGTCDWDDDRLNEDGWAYAWTVHAPEVTETEFRCDESSVEEPLVSFGNQRLECIMRRHKPGHTVVHFAYDA